MKHCNVRINVRIIERLAVSIQILLTLWINSLPVMADTWTTKSPLNQHRAGLVAAAIDGKVYAISGYHAGTYLNSVEEYDPVNDAWSFKSPIPSPRHAAAAVVVNDQIYVVGGYGGGWFNSMCQYDPATDTWRADLAPMPTAREYIAAASLNEKIYVIGGYNGQRLAVVEVYDTDTNSWTTAAPLPIPLEAPAAAVVNGKIYVMGGVGPGAPVNSCYEYDPLTNSWNSKSPAPTARYAASAAVVGGKIFVFGGFGNQLLAVTESYDPATDTWATHTDMPTPRRFTGAATVNNSIYVIGGRSADWNVGLNVVEELTIQSVPPQAHDDEYTTTEDVPLIVNPPGVLANDTPGTGESLTAQLVEHPTHGDLQLNPNGSFSYYPALNYSGIDQFTYRAVAGEHQSNIATVTITVESRPGLFLTAVPNRVLANNQDTSTLTLIYQDGSNQPVVGHTIRFRSTRPTEVFLNNPVVTDAYGRAAVQVRSSTPGVATITCHDETLDSELPVFTHLTFYRPRLRPEIQEVSTSLPVQGSFLSNVTLSNRVTVHVRDWNGEPGRVEFKLNGVSRSVTAVENVATTTYDMGSDLQHSRQGQWNELQITVYNSDDMPSETRIIRWFAVTLPDSLRRGIPGTTPSVSVRSDRIEYIFPVVWPPQNTFAVARMPIPFPFMYNTLWGMNSWQFLVEARIQFNPIVYPATNLSGTGQVRLLSAPRHSIYVAGFGWDISGDMEGYFRFAPDFGLDQLGVGLQAGVVVYTPDLLPSIVPVFPPVAVLLPFIDLYGRMSATAYGAINYWDDLAGTFTFKDTDLFLSVGLSLVVSIDPWWRWLLSAWVEAGGAPWIWFQFPGNSQNAAHFGGVPFVHQIGLDLFIRGGVGVNLWFLRFQHNFSLLSARFAYPNYGLAGYLGLPAWLQDPATGEWTQPNRDYLNSSYHQLTAGTQMLPQDDNWDVREENLIENIFPSASPALAWLSNRAFILYNYDDPNLPANQSTEIRSIIQQSDLSWQDLPVTDDTLLDSSPRIALDKRRLPVAVWQRLVQPVTEDEQPESRMVKADIAFSSYGTERRGWSTPVLITQDDRIDFNPQLFKGADGELYLLWLKSPDNVFPTDFANPVLPHSDIWIARWDGDQFVEPQRLIQRADTVEFTFGADSFGRKLLVWSADADGNAGTHDSQLLYTYWNGSNWTQVQPVWENALPQGSPTLSISSNGTPVLYLVRSGVPNPEQEDYTLQELLVTSFDGDGWMEPVAITTSSTLNDLQVIDLPDGRVSAVWVSSSNEAADIWTTVYDTVTQRYSEPVLLTQDELTQETQVNAAWDPSGNPSAVYLKRKLEIQEREVQDENGNWHTVLVTVPTLSDLCLLSHRPKPDLTIEELLVQPHNAGPGEEVTITAKVRNLRALAAANVQVRFYDGDPDGGGSEINTQTVSPNPLVGGSSGTASIQWTISNDGLPHILYARIDPDHQIQETNEDNNTLSYIIHQLDFEAIAPSVRNFTPAGMVNIEFGIQNTSPVNPDGTIGWELRLGSSTGQLIASGQVAAPSASETNTVPYTWNPEGLTADRHTVVLIVDPEQNIAETNENNNTAATEIALLPDLAINPSLSNLSVNGNFATVNVSIQNIGWANAENVVVRLLDGPIGAGNVLASQTMSSLNRFEDRFVSLNFNLPASVQEVRAVVNPDRTLDEIRMDNNEVLFSVPRGVTGDVNQDGCVDDVDLLAILFAFGQPAQHTVASAGSDNNAKLWTVPEGNLTRTLTGHTGRVWSVAYSPDGQQLATSSQDGTIKLWNSAEGSPLRTLTGHEGDVWNVMFAPDGLTLASAGNDGTIKLWIVANGELLRTLVGHTDRVRRIDFSANGELIASAGNDRTIRVWRAVDGMLLRVFSGHTEQVRSAKFSPDGQTLVSASTDNTMRVWRVSDGTLLATVQHPANVHFALFSPDGSLIASCSEDNFIRLWRSSDYALVRTLSGHTASVREVAFSNDGQYLASAAQDGSTRVWRVSDGATLNVLQDAALVDSVNFSPAILYLPEDLNRDGRVDDTDLLEVLFNFGSGC